MTNKKLSIQEHIEQERLQVRIPEIGCWGFLMGLLLYCFVWCLVFFILFYINKMASPEDDIMRAILKFFINTIISFILSLPITFYVFKALSATFEKFKPKIERKRSNDDVLDAD